MKSVDLKKKYIEFFKRNGHREIVNASLIPENDPTVLFTTAGMHPLVPFLLGERHPAGRRLVNVQKCIRTGDIEEVGDNFHLTFLEMLGNWSLGDYFKEDAIEMSFEFLTKELELNVDRLAISCFIGDKDAPKDLVSAKKWMELGITEERIAFMPKSENWWGPAGNTGPCGPDTEMFYYIGKKIPEKFNPEDKNWVEIWNDVFMEYNKKKRTLLVDGMHCLYDEKFNVNKKLFDVLQSFDARKILVVNNFKDRAEELLKDYNYEVFSFNGKILKNRKDFFEKLLNKYKLDKNEIIYFDHDERNIETAEEVGIKNVFVYDGKIKKIEELIKKNLEYYEILKQKNVDTGMGVERTVAVLNGFENVYEVDTLKPLMECVNKLAKKNDVRSKRIIVDHLRAAAFILNEGIAPSNLERGYVLRRLIRRAIRHGRLLGIQHRFCSEMIKEVFIAYKWNYFFREDFILNEIAKEEEKFDRSLNIGLQIFEKEIKKLKKKVLPGRVAFILFTSYGFPLEMTQELANEKKMKVDIKGYEREFEKHKELSRTAAEGKFKSGLADHSEKTTRLHTATHLLLQALKNVLNDKNIIQKGSNITHERLRFDFKFPRKLNDDELKRIENEMNMQIKKKLNVRCEEMKLEDAKKLGVTGVFEHKYGNRVKVYFIGDYSKELCGGPHVSNTKELGKLKIIKEESSSAGVRRIKAVLE